MQPEIDKIQLEIAKLQLERERRRHEATDTLRRGATAAGSTIGSALKRVMWVLCVVLGAILSAAMGAAMVTFMMAVRSIFRTSAACAQFADADLLYRTGCEMGSNQGMLIFVSAVGALYGAYQGHKIASGR